MAKVCLLSIDPQFDFCHPDGALSVPGAKEDMERLSTMVTRVAGDLDEIVCTLDSHRVIHIAHPIWWVDKDGNHPAPFTLIEEKDVTGPDPTWKATNPGLRKNSIKYVETLKKNDRYVLCIWPPHCLIGGKGYCVDEKLFEAFCEWERKYFAAVNYVTKGSNIFSEHYSAVKADVPDPTDPKTSLNMDLIDLLKDYDVIAISGEASSHCVRSTVMDVAAEFGDENVKKFVYLEDTSSPVPGFENLADDFVNQMTSKGMKIERSDTFLK